MAIEKGLLLHWWHYYGRYIYTLDELKKFEEIIKKYGADRVFDVVVASYICGDGSPTVMLASIRDDAVDELFKSLPDISQMTDDEKAKYNTIRENLLQVISQTA